VHAEHARSPASFSAHDIIIVRLHLRLLLLCNLTIAALSTLLTLQNQGKTETNGIAPEIRIADQQILHLHPKTILRRSKILMLQQNAILVNEIPCSTMKINIIRHHPDRTHISYFNGSSCVPGWWTGKMPN